MSKPTATMRAYVGTPAGPELRTVPEPQPTPDEALVRVDQATEAHITITGGPLAGGTTMHVSRIVLDLERWYAQDRDSRAARMFSPAVSARHTDAFAADAPSHADRLPSLAARHGAVGHTQTVGRARLAGQPRINHATSPPSTTGYRAPTSCPCDAPSRTSTPPVRS